MKLVWLLMALAQAGKRNKETKKRERLNKKAKKLGYANAQEMIDKTKSHQISPWLVEVYAPQPTPELEPTTTTIVTTDFTTTTTSTTTTKAGKKEKKRKRKEKKNKRKEEKKTTPRPTTTRRTTTETTRRSMGDRFVTEKTVYKNLNDVQSAVANKLFQFIFGQQGLSLPTPPPPPPNPSIARIEQPGDDVEAFELSEQGYIEMADDSSLLDFSFRRDHDKGFKATPICNKKSLGLELKCEDCAPGYPYIELCVQFRQNKANEAFKCKINCGPWHEVSGFNKVKCTNGVWKHESKEVEQKTCTKKT